MHMLDHVKKDSGICRQEIYRSMGQSRQSHHQWKRRERQRYDNEAKVLQTLKTIHSHADQIGCRKTVAVLQRDHPEIAWLTGRDTVARLRRMNDLLPRKKNAFKSNSRPTHGLGYPDLVTGREELLPGDVLVSDMTIIRSQEGGVPVVQVMDAVSRCILAARVVPTEEAESFIAVLKEARGQLHADCLPIHHSDRGSQYTSDLMNDWGVDSDVALSSAWSVYENTLIERLNKTMKEEYGFGETFRDRNHVARALPHYVRNYNTYRPHWALELRTPQSVFDEGMEERERTSKRRGDLTAWPQPWCFELDQDIGTEPVGQGFPLAPKTAALTDRPTADGMSDEVQNTETTMFISH
jgi:putative transposase